MIFERKQQNILTSILKTLLCAFVFISFYSCSFLISNEIPESKPEETITEAEIKPAEPGKLLLVFTPDFTGESSNNSRSAYPDFSNISALGLTFSIKSDNLTETAGTYDSTTGKINFEIPSREFTDEDFTVFANKSGKQILFATVALSYLENGASTTISDSISFRPYTAADGNTDEQKGSVTLKISVSDSNGSYEGYKIVTVIEGDTENKIKVTSNDRSNTIRTENTEDGKVSSGSYLAKISVYKNEHLINYILQTIVVWPGMDTNRWYLSDGSFMQEYHITATDEITCYVCGENPAGLYNATNGLPSLIDVAVASPEDTNDGTILAPLASISAAIEKCVNEEVKYTIICDGELEGFSITGNKRLLTIKGGGNSSNYSSITSRISVQSFSDVTLENISISDISSTNTITAYFATNNNKLTLNNCSIKNIYDNGGAVITCNSASNKNVTLELNNTVLKVENYAINIQGGSTYSAKLILKGSTYIDPSTEYDWWNAIFVNKYTSILIDGPLVDSHQIIAKIRMPSVGDTIPEPGTQLITVQNGADLAIESQRFEILDYPKILNTQGKIDLAKDIYVASATTTPAGSSTGTGSATRPLDTVTAAVAKINDAANSAEGAGDYTIHISGTIKENDTINLVGSSDGSLESFYRYNSTSPSTLTLCGTNKDNDKLDGNGSHQVLKIQGNTSYKMPVTIENLTIQNGKADSGGGIYVLNAIVKLGNGCVITQNENSASGNGGGGVYLSSNAELFMYGDALIGYDADQVYSSTSDAKTKGGNIAAGNGAAIYAGGSGSASPSKTNIWIGYTAENVPDTDPDKFPKISGNCSALNGGAIYVNSNSSLYMCKGEISYNYAERGGGLYAHYRSYGHFYRNFYGGLIKGNQALYGGGIYLTDAGNGRAGFLHLSGDTVIEENEATGAYGNGGAIYGASEIEIKDSVYIPFIDNKKNDVYLPQEKQIKILDTLTPPAAANGITATLTPQTYATTTVLLKDSEEDAGAKVAANYDKFAVTPEPTSPNPTPWEMLNTGYIQKGISLGFVTITSNTTDKFDGTQPITDSFVFIENRNLGRMNSLEVSDHEITQGEYEKYMTYYGVAKNIGTDKPQTDNGIGKYYPVYNINWYEAIMYCNLRSEAEHLTPAYYLYDNGTKYTKVSEWAEISEAKISCIESGSSKLYYYNSQGNTNDVLDRTSSSDTQYIGFDEEADGWRLPTEAEWEWLARECDLTNTTHYYSGGTNSSDVGWCQGDTGVGTSSHEIKGKNANNKNIYDMTGNVMEWCWDLYSNIISAVDGRTGRVYASNNSHSLRGGSWDYDCKITTGTGKERTANNAGTRYYDTGFRIVRTLESFRIGNKMKPDAVNDIVFTDGSAMSHADFDALDSAQKNQKSNQAVAVIFYKGTGLNSGSDTTTSRMLGIGLEAGNVPKFIAEGSNALEKDMEAIKCTPSGTDLSGTITFNDTYRDRNGKDNLDQIQLYLYPNDDTGDSTLSTKYPGYYFAKNYGNSNNYSGTLASGWFVPSIAELTEFYKNDYMRTVCTSLSAHVSIYDNSSTYWSSTLSKIFSMNLGVMEVLSTVNYVINGTGQNTIDEYDVTQSLTNGKVIVMHEF